MKRKLGFAAVAACALTVVVPFTARAEHNQVPAACVVVDSPPLHVQVGHTPHDPERDCTKLP